MTLKAAKAWDLVFPDASERRVALEEIAGGAVPSWCHSSIFHVAEADGEPAAALCTFEAESLGDTTLARPVGAAFERLGWWAERFAALARMLAAYGRCFPDFPPGAWIVESVGTDPAFRRRGLVARLLERALESGRAWPPN